MMCLSQTSGYAVRALSCLDPAALRPRLIRDVALEAGIPKPYLAKIINQLTARGLVIARRGYHGGVLLARPPEAVTLLEVVEAVEGPQWISPCILGMDDCDASRLCATHDLWMKIREQIEEKLRTTTLAEVIHPPERTASAPCAAAPSSAAPKPARKKPRKPLS